MRLLIVFLVASTLSGCASIAITLAGLGAGAGANHWMTSVNYHTFTEPIDTVRQAALTSLVRMEIELQSSERTDDGMVIKARTSNRDIEIGLEAITEKSTRMRVVAHEDGGFLLDGATAAEIAVQTEKVLNLPPPKAVKAAAAPAAAAKKPPATAAAKPVQPPAGIVADR